MKKFIYLLSGLAMLATTSIASAATINGSVEIVGTMETKGTLPTATGINFKTSGVSDWDVDNAQGDLEPMLGANTINNTLKMYDFAFSDIAGTSIWEFNKNSHNFKFVTESISNVQTSNELSVTISGTLSSSNFDNTAAVFRFTTQLNSGEVKASFSSGTSSVVPVPAAAWLFGSALFGGAAIGRRKSLSSGKADKTA
ncbi:VPLPA-CTERM sorting domain-containing protein [Thiocystis violacea]|uniref:VPLPA-CTERM sorting domain-containing protein n=1 Tax=Thiocystis violacea TaxID=13725 RepID=UPI0019053733|nr:VPLPA-CTERM sorting domain-containing protein [Thiocystis violacea]MBK1717077.1 hypothetical protein [Thiocystis violacea]